MISPDWRPHEIISVLYRKMETKVGHDLYVCIRCFREEYPGQESIGAYRMSSPYVLLRQNGSQKVIPGSVCESLKNLSWQLEQLVSSLRERVARIEAAEGNRRGEEYYEYERDLTNNLVLISCLARNIFHTIPRLSQQFSMRMFDYGGNPAAEMRLKELLDLFVHSRYMYVKNDYITDLVSEKLPERTVIANEFMGHKFKIEDFLSQIDKAIHSVTIKDLSTRLRGGIKSLTLDTPYQEMVFLIQNIESFSDLLEAMIPTGGYDFILDILFPPSEIPKNVLSAAKGREVRYAIHLRSPHVKVSDRVDEKKVRISVSGNVEYSVGGRVVDKRTEERAKEVDYADFFDRIIRAFRTGDAA